MHGGELITGQPEVDEAGPGDFGPLDQLGREMQLLEHPLRGLPGVGALTLGKHHRQVGREIAMTGVARPFEHEVDFIGAEPRGHPRQLGPQGFAHSGEAFPELLPGDCLPDLPSDFAPGLASAFPEGSGVDAAGLDSFEPELSVFSDGSLRGPLPSLP